LSQSEALYWKTRSLLVPDLQNSQVKYATRLRAALVSSNRWLDLGCGHAVYPEWLAPRLPPLDLTRHVAVGLDTDRRSLESHDVLKLLVVGDGQKLPFADSTFNLVTANMVLEHTTDPASLFAEVHRVLRPGGRFVVHTPNAQGYTTILTRLIPSRFRRAAVHLLQGRRPEDVYPTYYRANTVSILRELASEARLELERAEFVQTSPQLLAIPPLMLAEMLLIRALEARALARFRACLLVEFGKRRT
jgi:ubiquinone/menaquinone biosynthesis C-methylase UbiE